MSLKLGNTNIAGTQVLYSTTGNNTDGAMTQNATTSALSTKSNDIDVVHKTGNETISGEKITTAKIEMQSTNGSTSPVLLFHIPNVRYSRLIETSDGLTVQEGGGTTLDRLYAGSSDAVNTVVTTVNKSKSTNGYFKLGNGLIIQWGSSNVGTNTATTINLPTPFTSTNYKVVSGISTNSEGDRTQNWIRITDMTTTTFKLTKRDSSTLHWIAVGY